MPSLESSTCIYDHHKILLINPGDLSLGKGKKKRFLFLYTVMGQLGNTFQKEQVSSLWGSNQDFQESSCSCMCVTITKG